MTSPLYRHWQKYARSQWISGTSCDIVESWVPSQVLKTSLSFGFSTLTFFMANDLPTYMSSNRNCLKIAIYMLHFSKSFGSQCMTKNIVVYHLPLQTKLFFLKESSPKSLHLEKTFIDCNCFPHCCRDFKASQQKAEAEGSCGSNVNISRWRGTRHGWEEKVSRSKLFTSIAGNDFKQIDHIYIFITTYHACLYTSYCNIIWSIRPTRIEKPFWQ